MMPTVHRSGSYRFFFVTHDCREPPHIHVDGSGGTAKVWLQPVSLARVIGLPDHEVRAILRVTTAERGRMLEVWDEHCGRASDRGPRQ